MKEIQMFPQITEETEENLLTLEEVEQPQRQDNNENKSPSPPSSHSSNASTNGTTPGDTSLSITPADENHVPGPVPKIVAEDVDLNSKKKSEHTASIENEVNTPPARVRIRSLSGGAYRLSPVPNAPGRTRRQSGDDVLTGASPSRRPAFLEAFRPRSKSDSKGKKPTFLSTLKNSFFSTSASSHHYHPRKTSDPQQPTDIVDPLAVGPEIYRQRSRSGSEAKGTGPMTKMMDMFRNRSNSISIDQRNKKLAANTTMSGSSALMRRYSVEPDKRRHPLVSTHRSLELPQDLQANTYHRSETEQDLSNKDDTLIISRYFDYKRCYDVMPVSGKVVVLEVHLQVEKAFHSLVAHLIRAAPLWDSTKMAFIGMLTITDFIDILLFYESTEMQMKDLEKHKIFEWRRLTNKPDNFIYIQPEASLTDAIKLLVQKKVHRLPIYCPKQHAVLFVLTHKRILKYFYLFGLGKSGAKPDLHPLPTCFKTTISDLKIGTYENIATASLNMTVIDALKIFAERKVSALPVIENGSVVNIYAKFDVLALAKGKSYGNLTLTLKEALSERGEICEDVVTCTLEDTLEVVLNKIIDHEVHRLVVVGENKSVVGMLSLSDILKFLVLKPLGLLDVPVSSLTETETVSKDAASEGSAGESFPDVLADDFQQTACDEESTNNIASSDSSQKFETVNDYDSFTHSPTSLPEDNLEDVLENKDENCEDELKN